MIKLSALFKAVTRFWAAVVIMVEVDEVVALGVTVAVPAVTPDTVIVNPGKSARPENVFEFDVCVTVALFLVYEIVAAVDPPPTIEVTENGYGEAPETAPALEYADTLPASAGLLEKATAVVGGTHLAALVMAWAAVPTAAILVLSSCKATICAL